MISEVTPRMLAALDQLNHKELAALESAILADNDALSLQILAAKDLMILFENDPLMQLMYRDDLLWGDVMLTTPNVPAPKKSEWRLIEEDEDWIMPALRLRKHIWENFPVNVVPIQSKDSRERYAVQWHRMKFQEAREACEHGWQYMDFEEDTYRRLIKALSASRFWTVEEAVGDYDLCTIAMNFQEDAEKPMKSVAFTLPSREENDTDSVVSSASTASSGWEKVPIKSAAPPHAAPAPAIPVLRRLNDIKTYFPVIWNEVQGCKTTTYAVEIFGKKVKEQGLNMAKVKSDLLAALNASRSWTVLPATNERQVCLLKMNHL